MSEWWTDWPWRLIQTNLRETDMADISAAQVVRDLRQFEATVLMINAAGIIASYPTALPFHFQSPHLTGDSLADILDACHAANIRVIARTDFSKVRRPLHEAYPDWAYRTADGDIVDYNGDVHVCASGPYVQERMFRILEEMFTALPFDGVFFNMGGYVTHDYSGNDYGPCHCSHCREAFRARTGFDLPRRGDPEGPVTRAHAAFKAEMVRAHRVRVHDFVSERWPHVCVANAFEAGRGFIRQESNTALDRPLPRWALSAAEQTSWARTSHPAMVSSNTTVDFIDFPCRHVTVSPDLQSLRLAQSLAQGGALDWYLIGRIDNHADRSGFGPVREMFRFHARNQDDYRGLTSRAEVALLGGPQAPADELRGWYRALAETHHPADVMLTNRALDLDWRRYRALVVPDVQPLSDALAERIDRFVEDGGTLIASGRPGFRDGDGAPRDLPVLRCLGVREIREVHAQARASYFEIGDKADLPRFADTDLLYLDGPYVEADYESDARLRFRRIPPHPFGPPERCYWTEVSDQPGLVTRRFGRGQALYLPWRPGALYHRQGWPNPAWLMADVIESLAGLPPLATGLPPQVMVTDLAGRDGLRLIHLVNVSGHTGESFHPPLPLRDLEIEIRHDAAPEEARGLWRGGTLECTHQDGRLRIRIPRLGLIEAVAIRTRRNGYGSAMP